MHHSKPLVINVNKKTNRQITRAQPHEFARSQPSSLKIALHFLRPINKCLQWNLVKMREIVHLQAGQCGNQIGSKVRLKVYSIIVRYAWPIFLTLPYTYIRCAWQDFPTVGILPTYLHFYLSIAYLIYRTYSHYNHLNLSLAIFWLILRFGNFGYPYQI